MEGSGPHLSGETHFLLRVRLRAYILLLLLEFGLFSVQRLVFVKLSRADDQLLATEPIAWLIERAQSFADASVKLNERRGNTILHENVTVARVSDLSLKVAIEKALGSDLVSLKNDYVAFPSGLLNEVRRVVKKSGHVVKESAAK